MRLGLNLGYLGTRRGPRRPTTWRWPRRPTGSATRWSGRRRRTARTRRAMLAWIAGQTERIDVGSRRHADPGPHPGDDRDDRGHHRRALRRPVPARPRGLRPAGLRGLARRPVRQAAGPHPRVRRHRQAGAGPQAGRLRRRALHAAAAGRPRQGAASSASTRRASTSRSTWPRSARRTWSWPARSPTAGWRSSSPRSSPPSSSPRSRPAGRRSGKTWPASTWCPACRWWSATTWPPAPSWSAGTPPCTSAAWAAGSRTSTTSSPSGWATATPPREVQDLYLAKRHAGRRGGGAVGVHRPHLACSARRSASPSGCGSTPRPA